MRISSGLIAVLVLMSAACSSVPATGVDGPPGSFGRGSHPITSQWGYTPAPLEVGDKFQTVLVIAPVAGARCRGSSGTEPRGVEVQSVANARREVVLRIETEAPSPTISCLHDEERWERALPRVVVYQRPGRAFAAQGGKETWASRAYSYPPIFHVPADDGEGELRWEAWRTSVCPEAADLELREVCAAFAALKDADLGAPE